VKFYTTVFLVGISLNISAVEHSHQSINSHPYEHNNKVFISTGADLGQKSLSLLGNKSGSHFEVLKSNSEMMISEVSVSDLDEISHMAHEDFKRCGGFMVHKSYEEALSELTNKERDFGKSFIFADYSIDQASTVQSLIPQVQESQILSVIKKLSSFNNRYYKSQSGSDSQTYVFDKWSQLTASRSDITVSRFKHSGYDQPTITATIKGQSDDIIVVGGHADSVSGWWGRERARAPGADDNASGIATITEMIRVLVENNFLPQKTIVFAAYAAEEVGLLGSKDMATTFKAQNKNVIGVLQLDMTNFNGSDWDIVLISDYTNEEQNRFIASLIDTYLPGLAWGYDKCGYACSDHASWTSQGFPSSMPFESKKGDSNRQIHTKRDTIEQSDGHARHAQKFAKMGIAFVIELDK